MPPKVTDVFTTVKPIKTPPPIPTATSKLASETPEPILLSKNKTPIIIPQTSSIMATPLPKPVAITKKVQKPKILPIVESNQTTATSNNIYRVQLAAARNLNAAQKEWDRLRLKNLDVLGNLGSKITKYDSGANGIFYRLRAGPLKKDIDARALCKILAKRKTGCLVIRPGK